MAPYWAIPRDYLSDTPLTARYGVLVSQHDQLGAIPPPLFLSLSPWRACEMEVRCPPPPPKRGISAIPHENKAKCDTPSAILSRKGIARYGPPGGISHWAAKPPGRRPWGASSETHSALQCKGLWLLTRNCSEMTEKWPKTGHPADWVYC